MKIFLTGGSGFIGRQILKKLLYDGHEVLAISRRRINDDVLDGLNCLYFQGDITCWGTFEERVRAFAPDACIHAAWIQTHDYSEKICRINQIASVNLLHFCFSLESVKTVTALGSCLEYGKISGSCAVENVPEPKTWFSWCKHSIRTYGELQAINKNKSFCWARIFYAYGPGQRSGALIPSALEALASGTPATANSPQTACDFIHVADIAEGIVRATIGTRDGVATFNLGSGLSVTTGNLVSCLAAIWNDDIKLPDLIHTGNGNWSNNASLRPLLSWSPEISLEDGLKDLVANRKITLGSVIN